MGGEGMQASCPLYLNGAARDILREKLIIRLDTVLKLDGQKETKNTGLFIDKFNVSDYITLFYFLTCHALKTAWSQLSKVKLYRNDLKGNKNYFDL